MAKKAFPRGFNKPAAKKKTAEEREDGKILAQSLKCYRTSTMAENELRREQREDMRFKAGFQWDTALQNARLQDSRPCITVNRLAQFSQQIVNQMRQNRQSIVVKPMDGDADPKTAEVIQGVFKHVENISMAEVAYVTGGEMAVDIGRGWLVLENEWIGKTFTQDMKIKEVVENDGVWCDPSAVEYDYADMNFAHKMWDLTKDDYTATYGDTAPYSSLTSWAAEAGNQEYVKDWMPAGRVKLAKFYRVVKTKKKLYVLDVVPPETDDDPKPEMQRVEVEENALKTYQDSGFAVSIVRKRDYFERTVEWFIHNACQILERGRCPGTRIPIIPVIGRQLFVDGRRIYAGIIRDARDPQRMYNIWVSAETETIALAPRTPFIAALDQIKGFEDLYRDANRRNFSFLPYHPKVIDGVMVPPPQRNVHEPPINAIMVAVRQADNDLKAVTGIYDASLGERGPQESGKSLNARKLQGEVANFHYADNLDRARASLGRLMLEWAQEIYDVPTVRRINGVDNKERRVLIHAGNPTAAKDMQAEQKDLAQGAVEMFDISVGTYDVSISSGPSFESRRAETQDFMQKVLQAYPTLLPVIGDIVFQEFDGTPGALRIAKRLAKALPPQLQEQDGADGQKAPQGPDPQQLMQKLQEASGLIQQLTQQVTELTSEKANKVAELNTKLDIAQLQADTQLAVETMKHDNARAMAAFQAQTERIAQQVQQSHEGILALLSKPPAPTPGATPTPVDGAGLASQP